MTPLRAVLYTVTAVVLVIAVVVGGYLGGWWLRKDVTDRQVRVDNRNTGTQTAWHDEATDLINQAALLPTDAPQRAALERQACELIGRLTDSYVDDNLAAYQAQECQ
jgi:hypothetical protein